MVKELSKEKVVVKDGCLVAVQHIEKGSVHGIVVRDRTSFIRIIMGAPKYPELSIHCVTK